jgi:quercetin dioxygenase-like cupin family protein
VAKEPRCTCEVQADQAFNGFDGREAFTMETAGGAYVLQPHQAELRWMGETSTYFLATGEQTANAFALIDERAERGASVPLHLHAQDMESFYVLEGEITFYIGEQHRVRATAGAFVHLPAGTVHGFRIESETARYLILTTPRHGDFYRAITLPSREGGQPPLESIEGAKIKQAGQEYGISVVGPLPDNSD